MLTGTIGYLTAALIPFLIVSETLTGNAVYLSILLIGLAVFVLFYIKHNNIQAVYEKSEMIAAVLLSVLLVTMISVFDILDSGFLNMNTLLNVYPSKLAHAIQVWGYIVYLPSVCIASFVFVWYVLHIALENKMGEGYSKEVYRCCFVIIALVSLIYLFSTYPGIWMQGDVGSFWNQICEGEYNAWHTLGYLSFVVLCRFIKDDPFTVNVVQTIFWIFLNAYILKVLQEKSTGGMKIYTAVLIFVATPFNYLEVMYKDTVFSMGILAITVGIYHILHNQNIVWQDICALTIGGAFVNLCRYAGNITVMLAFMLLLLYFIKRKQKKIWKCMIGITIVQVCLFSFVNIVLMHWLNIDRNPAYIKYTMPMVAISAAASCDVEFDAEDREILEKVMPIQEWSECYNKYWADDIARSWGKIGDRIDTVSYLVDTEQYGEELLKINAKLLWKHPYIYIKSIFDMNNIVWKMAKPNDGYEWALCTSVKDEQILYFVPFKCTSLWTQFMHNMPLTNVIYSRGGVALFVILFSGVVWILKRKLCLLITLVPIVVNNCMLLISVPSQDPRYILPGIECAVFLAAVIFGAEGDGQIQYAAPCLKLEEKK